jgi:hypothetical protein
MGVTIIGQNFEYNRCILIRGNRQIPSNRFMPLHRCGPAQLRHVAAASIPTTTGEGQKKTARRRDTEHCTSPVLQGTSEFPALEVEQATQRVIRTTEDCVRPVAEELDSVVQNG